MELVIKQFAEDAGISEAKADQVFKAFVRQLVCKLPALREVVDDVFHNVEEPTLKEHVRKLLQTLQEQQSKETFVQWGSIMQQEIRHRNDSCELF